MTLSPDHLEPYRIDGLHHIQLAMPRAQEEMAERFYQGILGLERIEKPEHLKGRGGCWFMAGGLQLHLGVEEPFAPARKAHPAFLVDGLEPLRQKLESQNIEIVWDTQLDGHRRFYVSDPFGNRLELIERTL